MGVSDFFDQVNRSETDTMISFRVCGPKISVCCALLSVWGIVQLSFMALAMYFNSVAFIEDLKLPHDEEEYDTWGKLQPDLVHAYGETAKNYLAELWRGSGPLPFHLLPLH